MYNKFVFWEDPDKIYLKTKDVGIFPTLPLEITIEAYDPMLDNLVNILFVLAEQVMAIV